MGERAAEIHSDRSLAQRREALEGFKTGKYRVLIATDIAARGIDVTGIELVLNYDLPEDPENYVHRIGRTGRMGADGIAIAFVTREQGELLTQIEAFINLMIPEDRIEGFESCVPKPAAAEEKKVYVPVFGRRQKRYSKRL